MKFRQLVSKLLVAGVCISNTGINSLAGVLSEDGRYETFEGNSILIKDVYENDKADIEIEGNTLVNLIDYSKIDTNYYNYNLGYISEKNPDNRLWQNIEEVSILKPDTDYTILVENLNTAGSVHIGFNANGQFTVNNKITLFRTPSVIDYGFVFKVHGAQSNVRIMLLEGNYTNKDIPDYFEGLKSVGQNDKNSHKIEILSKSTITDGLVSHLKPGTSDIVNNTMIDLSGNNNNLRLYNGLNVVDDYLYFDGVNHYAEMDRCIQDDFTITLKVQLNSSQGARYGTRPSWEYGGLFEYDKSGYNNEFVISVSAEGYLNLAIDKPGGNSNDELSYTESCFNKLITLTITRSKETGLANMYIDGKLVGTM